MTDQPQSPYVSSIQVSGCDHFEGAQWKDAILHFMRGMLGGDFRLSIKSKLSFYGQGAVVLYRNDDHYNALTHGSDSKFSKPPQVQKEEILETGCGVSEMDLALLRFIWNNKVRMLIINFTDDRRFYLWKGEKRGQLGMRSYGLEDLRESFHKGIEQNVRERIASS